jgi:sRNA-binding protein
MSGRDDWRASADAGIAKLAERFPKCFTVLGRKRRPLKVGINADVVAAMVGIVTPVEVGAAIRRCVSAIDYERSLLAGTPRVDLQGRPAGTVTDSEESRMGCTSPLRARCEARARRAAKAKAKAKAAAARGPRVTLGRSRARRTGAQAARAANRPF